jgi:hypothetical protein
VVLLCAVLSAACGRLAFESHDSGLADASAASDGDAADAGDADALSACPPDALLCDDFETGDLCRWSGLLLDGPATLDVDATQVHTGALALDATVAPAASDGGNAVPYLHLATARSTGVLAVREWLSVASTLQLFNMTIVMHNETTNQFVAAGGNNTGDWVITDDDGNGPTIDHQSTAPTPAVGTWTCVELVYTFPPDSRIELFVDDTLVLDTVPSDVAPAFTDFQVGVGRADMTGMQVFVDDVVIADHRIGCE